MGTVNAATAASARAFAATRWPDLQPRSLKVRPASQCSARMVAAARARN